MLDARRAVAVAERLAAEIRAGSRDLLASFPVERYLELLDQVPELANYRYLSPELEEYCAALEAKSTAQLAESYHRLVLGRLIPPALERLPRKRLPDEVKASYEEQFERILHEIETNARPPGYYRHSSEDGFSKDLGVCTLRLIPIHGRMCERVVFPARSLFEGGWRQFLSGIAFLFLECGGRAPFLQSHWATHVPGFKEKITLEGVILFHRLVAKVMRLDEGIRGLFGTGWMNDPHMERVSPRLASFRYFHLANGARMFRTGRCENATRAATATSATRRRLYEEGKYAPTNYTNVWSRKRLLRWADEMEWHW
jgi:hypothetical protein